MFQVCKPKTTMLRESEDLKKWKLDHVHGLEDLKLLTCQFSPI